MDDPVRPVLLTDETVRSVMLRSLSAIERFRNGDLHVLKNERWLMHLALTQERNVNLERIMSLEDAKENHTLNYVERTLKILSGSAPDENQVYILEETLKWCETAKAGLPHTRKRWTENGFNLFVHNIGSARIYDSESGESDPRVRRIVHDLILTHGLIGQYIRGEVDLTRNAPLYRLVSEGLLPADNLKTILVILNRCIIEAVDEDLWKSVENQVCEIIGHVVQGRFEDQFDTRERLRRLRSSSIKNGEDFDGEYERIFTGEITERIKDLFDSADIWYVEAALYDFSFEEFIKILLIISTETKPRKVSHVSFECLMKSIYYQHDGKKRVNIYKKRIIEKYLSELSVNEILAGRYVENPHVTHRVYFHENLGDTVFLDFQFSDAGSRLIDFCAEAERSDVLYEKAVVMLFDLFGLRKDKYDRFYEEESYLSIMNQSIDYKKIILKYIKGDRIIDIGPGGGALMDLITDTFPDKKVIGVDISQNVIDSLKKRKKLESKSWDVIYGDALNLDKYIGKEEADTIIFCSIIHELYSYIEFNGRKFNHDTIAYALKNAFSILPKGGRIIIRDGIMTEPADMKRIIRFLSEDGMEFLERYSRDFKGREIRYGIVGQNEVMMSVNDAMEFLYTYTWGEKSYVHEVNEQFGYFTPSQYKEFIYTTLGSCAGIIEFKHYLQEGYTVALSPKIEFYDEKRQPVRLPDSTCLIVIEKR